MATNAIPIVNYKSKIQKTYLVKKLL